MTCPSCRGAGGRNVWVQNYWTVPYACCCTGRCGRFEWRTCGTCFGTGWVARLVPCLPVIQPPSRPGRRLHLDAEGDLVRARAA